MFQLATKPDQSSKPLIFSADCQSEISWLSMAAAAMLGRSSQAVRVPRKVFQQWPLLDEAGKVLSARPLFPELGGGPGHVVASSSRNKAVIANSFSVTSLTCIRSGFCGRQWKSKDQMLIWLLIPWQDTDLNLVLMPWLHVRIHICVNPKY